MLSLSRTTEERLRQALELSPRFYDAALDPSKWPAVLRDLRRALRVEVGQFNLSRLNHPTLLMSYGDGLTKEQEDAYLTYEDFATADPRTPFVVCENYRPRHCREFLTDKEWHASTAYKHLHEPWGFDYTLWYSVPSEDQDLIAILGVTRARRTGPFTQDDLDHLSLYVPHLRRAFEVTMALAGSRARAHAFVRAFEKIEAAVLIVDRFARPVHANPAARALLDQGRALTDANGPLRAVDGPTTETLRAAILGAGVAGMAGRESAPVNMVLPARDDGPPIHVSVSSLADRACETAGLVPESALVGVFITDPSRRYETDTERLQRLFGLTTTEAAILDALVRAGSARKVADETGRGYETVRKHIKVIRDKMGASSQTDLVRMVAEAR
ncbi:helix-turn-helix transcriptional regulator [Rhodospira trueperi]|uniref:Regulatory protein, luxR family n=1 Tax=Rhodospira trueperi TaxID=69960 RepID=A0A1G7BLV5_9PROT|nr:LuxR C-terminal-related transcriptional regulator [Rhodospira trueperi]SDE27446.1 regulatory protein, luxR family [Rhodospira trueperi]